jgi:hypothetical protein
MADRGGEQRPDQGHVGEGRRRDRIRPVEIVLLFEPVGIAQRAERVQDRVVIPLLFFRAVERHVLGMGFHRGKPVGTEILDPAALPRGWPHLPEAALANWHQLLSGVDPAAFVGRLAIDEHAGEEWRSKRQADCGSDGGGLRQLVQDVGDRLRAGDGVHRLRKMRPLPVGDRGDLFFRDAAQILKPSIPLRRPDVRGRGATLEEALGGFHRTTSSLGFGSVEWRRFLPAHCQPIAVPRPGYRR